MLDRDPESHGPKIGRLHIGMTGLHIGMTGMGMRNAMNGTLDACLVTRQWWFGRQATNLSLNPILGRTDAGIDTIMVTFSAPIAPTDRGHQHAIGIDNGPARVA